MSNDKPCENRGTAVKCLRCLVSGSVQGVCYRVSTQQQAQALKLRGYAKNLTDGRVEVLMLGTEFAVKELAAWLWQGPEYAKVTDVLCEEISPVVDFVVDLPRSFYVA